MKRALSSLTIASITAVQVLAGLTQFRFPSRYRGPASTETTVAALLATDRALNARIASAGAAAAYAEVTTSGSRLHRSGFMPSVGRETITAWMQQHGQGITASTVAVVTARSGDLGYSYGAHDLSGEPGRRGAYVRVWQRDAAGKWFVIADVTQ